MKTHVITTLYLLLLGSVGYFATDMYLPSLPALAAHFHASDNEAQMTLFAYILGFSLAPLIAGPMSDKIGRKRVILTGLALSISAVIGALFAPTIQTLSLFRSIQGIGLGSVLIAARASSADLFVGEALAKQMSLVTMLMPLVLAIAPTIGGYLQQQFDWQAVFLFLIVYLLFIFICAALKQETLKHPSDKKLLQIMSMYRSHASNPLFLVYGITFMLPAFGMFAYFTTSPFLFQQTIGLSPVEYGSCALYIGGTILLTGYTNIRLLRSYTPTQVLYLGTGLIILSGCLLVCFYMLDMVSFWSLLVPSLIYFSCMPFCVANAAAKCMSVVQHHFGAATALISSCQFLMGALGSLVYSLISNTTILPLGIGFTLVGFLSLLSLQLAGRLERRVPRSIT